MRPEPTAMKGAAFARENLPRHVAIIMDGNGRWAKTPATMPRAAGHVAGYRPVRAVVRAAIDIELPYLTLYAFSSENWKRPAPEITHLMTLFRAYFREDVNELVRRNVRMRIIGSRRRAEPDILAMIEDGETRTAQNTGLNLTFAFDYGAQEEIAAAAREMARAAAAGNARSERRHAGHVRRAAPDPRTSRSRSSHFVPAGNTGSAISSSGNRPTRSSPSSIRCGRTLRARGFSKCWTITPGANGVSVHLRPKRWLEPAHESRADG